MPRKLNEVRLCPFCGKEVTGHANKIYCNDACGDKFSRRMKHPERFMLDGGNCLQCGAPVPAWRKFCSTDCGKAYRWVTKYSKMGYHKKPRQPKNEHKCTKKCTRRFGFCIKARNLRRRDAFKKFTRPILCKSGRLMPRANFAKG